MDSLTHRSSFKSTTIQVVVSVLANWGMMNSGLVLGFPSIVVPLLLSSGPGLHASVNQASWVAGLTFASAPVGCLLAGPLIDWLGRRRALLLLNLTFASGWLVMAVFPQFLYSLYIGRLLTGLGLGLASCAAVTYTTEIVTARMRTTLVTLPPVMMAVGAFLIYLWAALYQYSWSEASYFGFSITMLSLVLTPLLPESPLWLLDKGHTEDAVQALMKLRGATVPEQVKDELETFSNRAEGKLEAKSWQDKLKNMKQPQAYKPFFIMNLFFFFQQMSGVTIVIVYAVDFTRDIGIKTEAYYIALGISCVRLLSAFLTSWACNRYGRRGPALLTGAVMGVSLLILATSPLIHFSPWFAGTFIFINVLSSSVGFSTLPWSMVGEVFPTNVRGVASGITACAVYFESFFTVKLYPGAVLYFGAPPVLAFFGISGLVGTFFLYLFLPETHGKTLMEIEEYFKDPKKLERVDDMSKHAKTGTSED